MTEESLDDMLKGLVGKQGQQDDLVVKIKNVLRRFKKEMEKRVIEGDYLRLVFGYIKEEGIVDNDEPYNYKLVAPVMELFRKKFECNYGYGLTTYYSFFKDTPVPDSIKKDIEAYKEIESKIDSYMASYSKEQGAKPSPQEFKDFVYSLFPEALVKKADVGYGYNPVYNIYWGMRLKYNISLPSTEKDKLADKIESKAKEINLDDI